MADNHTQKERSKNMSHIHSENTIPEQIVRQFLFAKGFRYRKHVKDMPGRPDIVLPKYHVVIFINGCFWHKHNCSRFVWPSTNSNYWKAKINGNACRDRKNYELLLNQGWSVIIVWECELKSSIRQERLERLCSEITK